MRPIARDALVAAIAFGAVGTAYSLQQAWNLQPCTMCIVQRYAFLIIGIGAAGRALFAFPLPAMCRFATWPSIIIGLLASARIQWAISVPSLSCGRDKIAAFLNNLPWVEWAPSMFEATGVCGDPVPPVLGLPFHVGSAALFLAIAVVVWFGRAPRAAVAGEIKA